MALRRGRGLRGAKAVVVDVGTAGSERRGLCLPRAPVVLEAASLRSGGEGDVAPSALGSH